MKTGHGNMRLEVTDRVNILVNHPEGSRFPPS